MLLNRAIASILSLADPVDKPPVKRHIGRALLQEDGRVFAPAPAAAIAEEHIQSPIISVAIIMGALAVFALFLYRESRKAKSRQHEHTGPSSTPSHPSGLTGHAEANSNRQVQVPFARQMQAKLAIVAPCKKHDHQAAVGSKIPSDSRKLTMLQDGWPTLDMDDLLRSSAEPLGTGVFGSAYKVKQAGLGTIVIKHLRGVGISHRDFKHRIGDITKLNHINVLPIVAYFFSETEKLLLYEYLSLGNLSIHLHGEGHDAAPLDWPTRARIALEVARGVAYIHSKGRHKGLVHGNIKPSNVLLRSDFTACVTDFGLTYLLKAAASVKAAANVGYRAPEVTENRHLTQKSDVYSYGVLLLELLTGKQPLLPSTKQVLDLPGLIHSSIHEEWTAEIFDPKIAERVQFEEEMVHMLKIAMECVQPAREDRPSMIKVVEMIKMVRAFENLSSSAYTDISTPGDPDFV